MSEVKTTSLRFKFAQWYFKSFFGLKRRIGAYRQMQAMIKTGVPIRDILLAIEARANYNGKYPNAIEAMITRDWIKTFDDGRPLADCLYGSVPIEEQAMIEAGELSGAFDRTLEDLVNSLKNKNRLKMALWKAGAYPIALFIMTLLVLWGFGAYVVPQFAAVVPVSKWTGTAADMATMAAVINASAIPTFIGMTLATIVYFWSLPRWSNRLRTKFDRIPPWSLYRIFTGAMFMISFSALVRAEVPVQEALPKLTARATPYLRKRLTSAHRLVENGVLIGDALMQTGYDFPDRRIVSDLVTYSQMANFSELLNKIANEWVEESVELVTAQAGILKNIMLLLVGGVIGWLSWGMYDMLNVVNSMTQMGH